MTKPQGTYLRGHSKVKTTFYAAEAKRTVSLSREDELADFYDDLLSMTEKELKTSSRFLHSYIDDLKKHTYDALKGEMKEETDPRRKKTLEILEFVRQQLEFVSDVKQLDGQLQVPVNSILHTPFAPAGPDLLTAAIAISKVLDITIRLIRRRPRRQAPS